MVQGWTNKEVEVATPSHHSPRDTPLLLLLLSVCLHCTHVPFLLFNHKNQASNTKIRQCLFFNAAAKEIEPETSRTLGLAAQSCYMYTETANKKSGVGTPFS